MTRYLFALALATATNFVTANTLILHAGAFDTTQGEAQNIGIQGVIGDYFSLDSSHAQNILLGAGYFFDGAPHNNYQWMYGIDAYYLAQTEVTGKITQENYLTALNYSYYLRNIPLYVATRALVKTHYPFDVVFDLGLGPNFITAYNFIERPLNSIAQPDNIFCSHTTTAFSATAGLSLKFSQVIGQHPIELGYRFFYLGEGHLNKTSDQVLNTLKTGTNYANAITFSIAF